MSTESKMSKEVYDAVLLTAGADGVSMACIEEDIERTLRYPRECERNVKVSCFS